MRSRDPADGQEGRRIERDASRAESRRDSEEVRVERREDVGVSRVDSGVSHVERRAAPRYRAQAFGVPPISCRVNPGHEVQLANLSSVGVCVEATFALLPGRVLQLHLQGRGRRVAIETRVAWCAVTAVTMRRGLRFEAGLAFARWVDVVSELRPEPAGSGVGLRSGRP